MGMKPVSVPLTYTVAKDFGRTPMAGRPLGRGKGQVGLGHSWLTEDVDA